MFQAELRVATGKQMGSVITLPAGKFLVGREEDCHLRPNSDLVSRHHCVFTLDEYSIRLRDLGSTNGTFVNGERIRGQVMLKENDRVVIGKLEFDVVIRDPSMEETSTSLEQNTSTGVSVPAHTPAPPVVVVDPSSVDLAVQPVLEQPHSETRIEMPTTTYQMPMGAEAIPGMMPPGMGMYGQMPPQMHPAGYPQYPPQYGYPGYQMPGYYQQPMGYPPMGMYPPQMPMVANPAVAAVPEPAADSAPKQTEMLEYNLPDPESTGAKPPEPPKPVAQTDGAKPASMRDIASDIINKYRTRPPAG